MCKKAVDVWGTAGAAEDLYSLCNGEPRVLTARNSYLTPVFFKSDLERIFVKEGFAVKRGRGKHSVVKHALGKMPIFGLLGETAHTRREHHHGNGAAALGVSRAVGQVIRDGKALGRRRGANTACNIHFLVCDIRKDLFQILKQKGIVRFGGKVGNAAVKVERAHAVTVGTLQVTDIHVILRAKAVVLINGLVLFVVAAHLQKEARHLQVFFSFGVAVKLDECQLDLLVTGSHKLRRAL